MWSLTLKQKVLIKRLFHKQNVGASIIVLVKITTYIAIRDNYSLITHTYMVINSKQYREDLLKF